MVVDDSGVLRGVVSQWIEAEPDLEVVARHANGKRAVADVARCAPDVIVLDIDMPEMDGLEALPLLRRACPKSRILMVSALTKRNAEISLKALELGAVDCLPKPEAQSQIVDLPEFQRELLRKIRGLVRWRTRAPRWSRGGGAADHSPRRAFSPHPPQAIVIGSSTGGPEALNRLLAMLAPSLRRTPVLVAQHMPPLFTAALAERLGRASGLKATEGRAGEEIVGGRIYVAPGDGHMAITSGARPRISISHGPAVNFCRPCVDILFDSAARAYAGRALGIVLTGMGMDGAVGAKRIAEAGGSVIAQDFGTSVVWGMPSAAAESGACAAVLPLDEIAATTERLIAGKRLRGQA
ncbi:MAG: chemotaxis response regulator protein-glutamate methylesterase [Methyloceanibacter sp.]|nr:chemotaxis response regulator protein-glutamate methylesterase [Methyloceanibacter sp.]